MGNTIVKIIAIIAVAAAGLLGWQWWSANQSETEAPAESGEMDAAAAEQLGRDIGAQIGADVGKRIGEETVAKLDMSAATETVAAAEPETTEPVLNVEPAPAPAEPAPAPEPVPAEPVASQPAPEPAAAPAPAETSSPTETAEAAPSPPPVKRGPVRKPARPRAECAVSSGAWWASTANSGVPIRYIGTATSDGKVGMVIVSVATFSASSGAAIKLEKSSGEPVTAEWTVGGDPHSLFVRGLEIGCYKLTLGAELTSAEGRKLGSEVSGLIELR